MLQSTDEELAAYHSEQRARTHIKHSCRKTKQVLSLINKCDLHEKQNTIRLHSCLANPK